MTWEVLTVDRLDVESLVALREERVAAIRIAGYCSPEAGQRIAQLLVDHPGRTSYLARWATRNTEHGGVLPGETFSRTDTDRVGPIDTTPEAAADSARVVDAIQQIRSDLVVWNPALPHAVQPFDDPPRVTLQTWLLFEQGTDPADFAVRLLN